MTFCKTVSIVSLLAILVAGCASTPAPTVAASAPTASAANSGNAAVVMPLPKPTCRDIAEIGNTLTPPVLYDDMVECAKESQYEKGVSLFALAGSYTFYDALRVEDTSAHRAHSQLLQESLDSLDLSRKDALKAEIKKTLGSAEKMSALCGTVAHIGAPEYYPAYMVRLGTNGAAEATSGAGLIKGIDLATAWKTSLDRFLHCPAM